MKTCFTSTFCIALKKDEAMLWNASALNGYPIKAIDGQIGIVADLLFDEQDWAIRWLVVDTGDWISGRRVLLPVSALGQPDPETHSLPVALTMKQVEESPDVKASDTLSHEAELLVCAHYDLPHGRDHYLWASHDRAPADVTLPNPLQSLATSVSVGSEIGKHRPHVHSISTITGASIEAADGDIGHGEDFLIDAVQWQVRYLVVHTSSWRTGEKLLVSPLSINGIDWTRSVIHLAVTCQKVKDSPHYDAAQTVDGAFDELFNTYYGIRWTRR